MLSGHARRQGLQIVCHIPSQLSAWGVGNIRLPYAGVPDTRDNLYAFFLGRVRDRLHVILCFSPVGAFMLT